MTELIADEISPRLYMGPVPPHGHYVAKAGFKTLVLAATEREYKLIYHLMRYEPVESKFPGVRTVFVVGLTDDYENPPTKQELKRVLAASEAVKYAVRTREKALVTCVMGRNRSGLITALALRSLTGSSGHIAMEHVRARRRTERVLENPQYSKILTSLPAHIVSTRLSP